VPDRGRVLLTKNVIAVLLPDLAGQLWMLEPTAGDLPMDDLEGTVGGGIGGQGLDVYALVGLGELEDEVIGVKIVGHAADNVGKGRLKGVQFRCRHGHLLSPSRITLTEY
jgi:hypothetical protein